MCAGDANDARRHVCCFVCVCMCKLIPAARAMMMCVMSYGARSRGGVNTRQCMYTIYSILPSIERAAREWNQQRNWSHDGRVDTHILYGKARVCIMPRYKESATRLFQNFTDAPRRSETLERAHAVWSTRRVHFQVTTSGLAICARRWKLKEIHNYASPHHPVVRRAQKWL